MSTPDKRPDHRPDARVEQRARELYLEASRHLDPATAGRLRAARRTALEAGTASTRHARVGRALLPVGALAAIALAALMMWQPLRQAPPVRAQVAALTADQADNELPPDPDSTDPGLYQNLDFYGWLAASDSHARH